MVFKAVFSLLLVGAAAAAQPMLFPSHQDGIASSRVRSYNIMDVVDGAAAEGQTAIDDAFEAFIVRFNRTYGDDPSEKARRRAFFVKNVMAAQELHRQSQGGSSAAEPAVFGITKFSDEDMEAVHRRRRSSFANALIVNYQVSDDSGRRGGNVSTSPDEVTDDIIQRRRNFLDIGAVAGTSNAAKFKASHPSSAQLRRFSAASSPHLDAEMRRGMEAAAVEDKLDWRTLNAVSPVKFQGSCGSCWSFSVTGNVESLWVIAGHPATLLSEEELIACDTKSGNDGCDGGLMQAAFWWILKYRSGYLSNADLYPFTSGNGVTARCDYSKSKPAALIYDWGDVKQSEQVLVQAVSQIGPICIGVDSTSLDFYEGGVMTQCQNKQLDHAVLIVGYDTTTTPPYWIVKNSWGVNWGEAGYVRIAMGNNLCGIRELASTALVATGNIVLPAVAPTTAEPSHAPQLSVLGSVMLLAMGAVAFIW